MSCGKLFSKEGEEMRRLTVFMVLGVLAALVTGSVLALPQAETVNTHVELAKTLEDLLLEQEQGRLAYEAELRQAGEEILAQKEGELRREQAQMLHNDAAALRREMQEQVETLQREMSRELLGLQLELILVSLTPGEQDERLAQIEALQEELQRDTEALDAEYQEKLLQLQAEHEELARQRILSFQAELETALQDELTAYHLELMQQLEEAAGKLHPQLSRGTGIRPY
jgi:hypothetical protein